MRSRIIVVIVLLALPLAYWGATRMEGLAWRIEVIRLKALGEIDDLGWLELIRMLRPGSGYYLEGLTETRSPFVTIVNPFKKLADRAAGAELFRNNCAGCHGMNARGAERGPDLVGGARKHGDSPWGMFRVLQRGIPGTAMPAISLSEGARWQIISFIELERAGEVGGDQSPASAVSEDFSIPFERLVDAASEPQNWLTYSGRYSGWRYSTLNAINRENVSSLQLAWARQLNTVEWVEASPIVVDGIMFFTEPPSNVWAVDASSGEVIWVREFAIANDLPTCCGRVNRGVAVLGRRVYVGTLDGRLVSLAARTGEIIWQTRVANPDEGYTITTAPLAVNNNIIIGVSGGEYGIRGFLDAYDADSGQLSWRFNTIPQPGQPGHETWAGESWKTGGGPTWVPGTFDPALGLLYWGVGNPSPDFDASVRRGDNLYTNSVVALNVESGKLAWHFQFTPEDVHDFDANQTPMLVDYGDGASKERVILWANRNGFYYVLNREDGQFILARPFVRQTWAERIDETGRPIRNASATPSTKGVIVWPSASGATNWQPPSYSPLEDMVFVPYKDQYSIFFKGAGGISGEPAGKRMWLGSATVSGVESAQTGVRAISPLTGEIVWDHQMPLKAKKGMIGGVLTTEGGLLFTGDLESFCAIDSHDGRELWRVNLGGAVNAAPVTYAVSGRQFVVIAAGSTIFAFSRRDELRPQENDGVGQ